MTNFKLKKPGHRPWTSPCFGLNCGYFCATTDTGTIASAIPWHYSSFRCLVQDADSGSLPDQMLAPIQAQA